MAKAKKAKAVPKTPVPRTVPVETVPVMLPLALPGAYDYLVPDGMPVEPGQFVVVPLGPVERLGAVWTREGDAAPVRPEKLREIIEVLDDLPKLPRVSLDFADWVANYTLTPPGMVLRMMMSAAKAFDPPAPRPPDDPAAPMFDARRDYLTQIAHYHAWQGRGEVAS